MGLHSKPTAVAVLDPSVRDGTERELARLQEAFRLHGSYLRRTLARLVGPYADPDDLLQDVFLIAWNKRSLFESGSVPRAWLHGVAVKVAATARRNAKIRRFLGLDAAAELVAPDTATRAQEQMAATRTVYALLDKLSEKKRTAFILFEIEGLTGEEIAEVVGCPLHTVWTRLYHARREFLKHLERETARESSRSLGRG